MYAPNGRWVFFFNHTAATAPLDFSRTLEKPATRIHEIMTGQELAHAGTNLNLKADIPAQSVRVYRIDF